MKKIQLAFLFLVSTLIYAQETVTIQGKITDKELGDEPLVFANVLIKGTNLGTTSDFDGLYEFNNLESGCNLDQAISSAHRKKLIQAPFWGFFTYKFTVLSFYFLYL